jgi:hypothetical protein
VKPEVVKGLRASADSLEAMAEAQEPACTFDLMRLAVSLRDWALEIELERASATNVTILHSRPRYPGER